MGSIFEPCYNEPCYKEVVVYCTNLCDLFFAKFSALPTAKEWFVVSLFSHYQNNQKHILLSTWHVKKTNIHSHKKIFIKILKQQIWGFSLYLPFNVRCGEKALMPYVNRDCPAEHAHSCSMIWTFSVDIYYSIHSFCNDNHFCGIYRSINRLSY